LLAVGTAATNPSMYDICLHAPVQVYLLVES
jgi:hypothetical protein